MARPIKIGLDYFPFDTGFFGDRKIRRLLKTFGGNGVEVYVFVLCEIYRDKGYYIQCDENFVFDIADALSLKESFVREVIRHCVVCGLFDQRVYDVEKSLTSTGVQKRYLEVKSRSSVEIDSRFLCQNDCINETENEVNATETPINDAEMRQRKEKKSKEKESKENRDDSTSESAPEKRRIFVKPTIEEIRDYCQSRGNSISPDKFFDHYQANGWIVGKTKMKDWRAAVRLWESRQKEFAPQNPTSRLDEAKANTMSKLERLSREQLAAKSR